MNTKILTSLALTALLVTAATNVRADACKSDADCVSSNPSQIGMCNHWQCKYYPAPEEKPAPVVPYHECSTNDAHFHEGVCEDASLPDHELFKYECLVMKEMVKLDPSLNPDETVCCLVVEDSELQFQHFMTEPDYRAKKMAQCGGKMPSEPTPPASDPSDEIAAQIEKCSSIKVGVGGSVNGPMNVCCNVVNNGGSVDEILQACSLSISGPAIAAPAQTSDGSEASDDSGDTAGDAGSTTGTVAPSVDDLHVAGGTGGCSLIR